MKGIGTLCVLWLFCLIVGGYHKWYQASDVAPKNCTVTLDGVPKQ